MPRSEDSVCNAIAALESSDISKLVPSSYFVTFGSIVLQRSKLLEVILSKGRWMCRSINPFMSLSCVLYARMPSNEEL